MPGIGRRRSIGAGDGTEAMENPGKNSAAE